MEITLELSFDKYPSATQLDTYWSDNQEAMYAFMKLLRDTGARGRVSGVADVTAVEITVSRLANGKPLSRVAAVPIADALTCAHTARQVQRH